MCDDELNINMNICPSKLVCSEIFCHGDLLHTVQMAKIFPDSKTFVDMKLRTAPDTTLANFREWQQTHEQPSPADIRKFVEEHFEPVGSEFVKYVPEDYVENPRVLETIRDPDYRQWAKDLNDLWLVLGRKMTENVAVSF